MCPPVDIRGEATPRDPPKLPLRPAPIELPRYAGPPNPVQDGAVDSGKRVETLPLSCARVESGPRLRILPRGMPRPAEFWEIVILGPKKPSRAVANEPPRFTATVETPAPGGFGGTKPVGPPV